MNKVRYTFFIEDNQENQEVIDYLNNFKKCKSLVILNIIKEHLRRNNGNVSDTSVFDGNMIVREKDIEVNEKKKVVQPTEKIAQENDVSTHQYNKDDVDTSKLMKGLSIFGGM